MDRFIKGMEAEDLRVEVTDGYQDAGTFACEGRDRTQVHVHEKNKRVKHEPTAKELREKEQLPGTRIPKWDDVPTGELVLTPGGTVDFSSEQAFDQFIKKAVADVIEELARARKKREEEEAAQRHEWDCRMEAEHEKERVEAMHEAAASLQQYRILTDKIEEVRRFGRVPEDQSQVDQSFEEWLVWAEAQARRIHPLGS